MNLFQIKSYLKYCFKARYSKGYGLHSPFVFHLVREVFYCKYPFYAFDDIVKYKTSWHIQMKSSKWWIMELEVSALAVEQEKLRHS